MGDNDVLEEENNELEVEEENFENLTFNDLLVGDVFTLQYTRSDLKDLKFVKIANVPDELKNVPQNKQPPNSICLNNLHYTVITYKNPVKLIKSWIDFI